MEKEKIGNWAGRMASIADDIVKQLQGKSLLLQERFFTGLLFRQAIILEDISNLLTCNALSAQMSTFILFRCLMDDFITVLYLQNYDFDNNEIIKHTADAYGKKFMMIKDSRLINDKYFGGQLKDMVTEEYEIRELNDFYNNPDNKVFFENLEKKQFKSFPPISKIVRNFQVDGIGAANAHSLILWQLFSKYTHYSYLSYQLEISKKIREIEIEQLQEALSYCYKTICIASDALNAYGIKNEIRDTTNVKDEVMKGYISHMP